jgi:hypothetical protein
VSYEPISVYGNYFVGVDGEGVGDDYVLLDSSLPDYPRLYTGARLTTLECLDWLWGMGKAAGYCTFVLFGAGYDYNNWLRDIPFEDCVRLSKGQMVRVGDYLVLWQQHFKFSLRKVRGEDTTQPEYSAERYKYDRIQTKLGDSHQDYIELQFWDVHPYWQTSFVKALDMTLKEPAFRALIERGKEARGSFTHEEIEWVSEYNKAECNLLAHMCVELDRWFDECGIRPMFYNGPGSAAKAMLRQHQPYLHAGREISDKTKKLSSKVRGYKFPGADDDRAMLWRSLCAYAGALNRQLKIGYHPGTVWQYDLVSAYPSAMLKLPCLSHGHWERTSKFDLHTFGLWKVRYKATKRMNLYPFFWRTDDGSIEYPHSFDERWCHTYELAAALAVDARGITILDGWAWVPGICDNPWPFWWIGDTFLKRQQFKREGNAGAANGLKLPLNSAYGSIAQARGGMPSMPPWSQQLVWAGAITAYTRARLYLAYQTNPDAVVHMATDGIISLEELPLKLGDGLGEWERTELHNLTCVQYGVYATDEKHRERGFTLKDEQVPEFITAVHDMWRTGHWSSLSITQHRFVTCGLVAQSENRYEEWCHWQDTQRTIELDQSSIFKIGFVEGMPGLSQIHDASHNLHRLGASTPYEPKWGKGEDFPRELKADAIMEAVEIGA